MAKTPFSRAFEFVGSIKPSCVTIKDKRIFATKNGVTVSTPIDEDLNLCADYESLKLALASSNDAAVTVENFKLSVNSDEVNIYVDLQEIESPEPDPMIGLIGQPFIDAINQMSIFLKKTKDNPAIFHLMVNGQSVISSDGNSIFEMLHGESLPTDFVLSKIFCDAINKSKGRDVWGVGASDSTISIHFSDGSWVRAENWTGEWLAFEALLPYPIEPQPFPETLSSALGAIKRFCGDGWAYLNNGRVQSNPGASAGASREVPGMVQNGAFGLQALLFAVEHCRGWEETEKGHLAVFGDRVRGLIGAWSE